METPVEKLAPVAANTVTELAPKSNYIPKSVAAMDKAKKVMKEIVRSIPLIAKEKGLSK